MSGFSFAIYLAIVIGATLVATVKALANASIKTKQYDLEIEKMRKEGTNDRKDDSESS